MAAGGFAEAAVAPRIRTVKKVAETRRNEVIGGAPIGARPLLELRPYHRQSAGMWGKTVTPATFSPRRDRGRTRTIPRRPAGADRPISTALRHTGMLRGRNG